MAFDDRNRLRIAEEAASWLFRIAEDDSQECQREFTAWSLQSPQHVEEFLFAKATLQHLQSVDPEKKIDLNALEGGSAVVPFAETAFPGSPSTPKAKAARWNWRGRLAAGVASALLALGALKLVDPSARTYSTDTGDQTAIKLKDGSVMHLNTHSRVEVAYSRQTREVRLIEGEALFTVERDAVRPFRVLSGEVAIQAVGTQFNVYRQALGTQVSVVEGSVKVTADALRGAGAVQLTAGDEGIVIAGKVVKKAKANVERAVAWRSRRLIFQADTLENVIHEFNRYETRRPIRLAGDAIRRQTVSGVFDADDARPLIEFLKTDPELRVEEREREIIVRPKD